MNKRKSVIIMLIVFLAIGFATISTTLVLNGILAIGENKDDFNIIFTKAKLNGVNRNNFISEDKKHINFVSNELKSLDDKAILTYEVTNTSRNYDADVSVTCTAGSNEYITFEYTPHQMEVLAGETKTGSLTASMFKVVDKPTDVPIECTLTATAKERESLGEEYVAPFSKSGVMMAATNDYSKGTGMWENRSNVTKVIFEDKLIPHETTEALTFDVSEAQDKSVMAYLVPNDESLTITNGLTDTTAYTLYIQGNTGVKANRNSSSLLYRFKNLLEIENIEYLDTSNVTNMANMFASCENLTGLNVSNFDTSKVTDMSMMFSYCKSLTTLDVRNFDTSNVTNMRGMFDQSIVTTIDVSNFDTSKVTNMFCMFYHCSNLTTLDLSNFDTSKVTNMHEMFLGCRKIEKLNLSNFITSNVTDMGLMFTSCSNLTILDISSFDTSKVSDMGSMFSKCSSLTTLDLSNFDTSNVTDMYHMFIGCSNLTSINVSSFNTSKVTDMDGMFYDCSKLVTLDLSSFDTSKVTSIGNDGFVNPGIFRNCTSLIDLDISNFTFDSITHMRYAFYQMPTTSIIKVKDETAQNWILALTDVDRPSSWTTDNVVIKTA